MSQSLQSKVALVTGGSRGLGAATARSLADAGADVAITYTASADKAAQVVKELEDKGVQDKRNGLHWKTRALVAWAAGHPFAWVDDEITDTDRAWVSAHHHGSALLHRVDPSQGLTAADYATLDEWLQRTHGMPPSLAP